MAITLPAGLPAVAQLRAEGLAVAEAANSRRAAAMRVALVNLMPRKEATEVAFARLLAQTGQAIDLTLVIPGSYTPRHVSVEHLERFYQRWPDVRDQSFDALIVTGAPVETLPFEEVAYWSEFREMVDWAESRVGTTLYVCWAAQAALYARRGVPKKMLPQKAFGVFEQKVLDCSSALMQGIGGTFPVPVSRHTTVDERALALAGLNPIAASAKTGPCIVDDEEHRAVYVFDHFEYEANTLQLEYERDLKSGHTISAPRGPHASWGWQTAAGLFFRNWLNRVPATQRGDIAVGWLLDDNSSPPAGRARLVIQAASRRHLLTSVLQLLHRAGFEAASARVSSHTGAIATVEAELHNVRASDVERAAKALLSLPRARRALYRGPGRSGGVLRPQHELVVIPRAA